MKDSIYYTELLNKSYSLMQNYDFDGALNGFNELLLHNERDVVVLHFRANIFYLQKDYTRSIEDCDKAIDCINLRDFIQVAYLSKIYLQKAYSLQNINELAEASTYYSLTLTLDPSNTEAKFQLACIYSIKNDNDMVFRTLSEIIDSSNFDKNRILTDTDLENFRNSEYFKDLKM